MCGIFGVVATRAEGADRLLDALFTLSESRGKEAAGLAGIAGAEIRVLKSPASSKQMMKTAQYAQYVRDVVQRPGRGDGRVAVVGHSRLVTNGSQTEAANNQPIACDGLVGVHNGIVVNEAALWQRHPELARAADVDTEVLLRLVRHRAATAGGIVPAVRAMYADVEGVVNLAMFAAELDQLLLATNSGSIYWAGGAGTFAFASERYILETALARVKQPLPVAHLRAGGGLLVDLATVAVQPFGLAQARHAAPEAIERNGVHRTVRVDAVDLPARASSFHTPNHSREPAWFTEAHERHREAVAQLRRCVRCVQPESVPFVGLDAAGLCVDCRNHVPIVAKGRAALEELLGPHRSRDGSPDVLVPLSGGRDSCFTLHHLVTELGMNPIAYTYDWGMVTDLARRNCSRLCSKLGVEHVIVSADITQKRAYIRKNVDAWLRAPDLGVVPLFMAGDKQFFWYAEQVQRRAGVKLQIWGNNRLERSDFKTGFCGFDRGGYKDNSLIRMGAWHNARILAYYLSAYVKNPAYVNASIPDTLFSYFLYYVKRLDYVDFYDYIAWDEPTIVDTIRGAYDWEVATDTTSTWRIGDGTASFYNYIYWTVAGFTESDTFRSGQVRAGTLTRAQALAIVEEENRPRYASLDWYCRTIGIDPERALRTINRIPKRLGV
ncbi:MAG: hypothetical protein KF773_40915 [Deltaproteobacteria bacterium]|nr:hypothetical protein [Deltaproteobacteria bacterium]